MKITDMKFITRDIITDGGTATLWPVAPSSDIKGMFLCKKKHLHTGEGGCWFKINSIPDDIEPDECLPITIGEHHE